MFESLVSSRVRRTLFEYLLTHEMDRFYLRGLAKELDLSVTPLRRELKRLEQLGVLTSEDEGSLKWYRIQSGAPAYHELRQVAQGTLVSGAGLPSAAGARAPSHPAPMQAVVARPVIAEGARRPWRLWPAIALACGGVAVLAGGLLAWRAGPGGGQPVAVHRHEHVTVTLPPAASGTMQSSRWRVVPGSFGGLGGGADETY